MTESARQALIGHRDFSTLQWHVVPLRTPVGWT